MQAKLRAEKGPESQHHAEVIDKLQKAVHDISIPKEVLQEAKDEAITQDDFLELRKELITRVRQVSVVAVVVVLSGRR